MPCKTTVDAALIMAARVIGMRTQRFDIFDDRLGEAGRAFAKVTAHVKSDTQFEYLR